MEDVWPVPVHEHARIVVVIVRVAADVRALVADKDFLAGHAGEPLRQNAAGEARTDDQVVEHRTPRGGPGRQKPTWQ